ncbi:sulfotransferase family protein [Flavihumibacter petaseus]|uniref:Sulfotransferase n=1 Tax=Flavihumibacter petaseus NBRC 106054 TaxID=1220578 RepID=A0A0E9MVL8_9BACT|nr:sulfotransferase [Flavihumibacter petaseus]GAO41456.1 hypothetical protein FPE01S_01_04690 [Flavihumibacter petaseus NBRC 106054]
MNRLFPLPFFTFLRITREHGGIARTGIKNLPGWLIKTILLEPFRWIEIAFFRRKIEQHTITRDPIFVLGFYRSGTSFLHEFISQDQRLRYHSVFQMIFPEIMLTTEKWLSPLLEGICRIFRLQDPVHRIPMSFRYPGEEDGTMTTAVNPRGAQWGYFFPEKMKDHFNRYVLFDDVTETEQQAWTKDFLFLLKKISLSGKGRQLVLKSPPNTARIKLLLSLFPNAKFIFIHRHPVDVYLSNKRFWKVTHRIYALGRIPEMGVNQVILDTYSRMMDRYLEEKSLVPSGQLVEIPYDNLVREPVDTMRAIYRQLGLDDFSHCEKQMQQFADLQQNFVRLKHEMPPDELQLVTDRFERYISHWQYNRKQAAS